MEKTLAVLIPSRGLPCAQSMQALDVCLEKLRLERGVQAFRRWSPGTDEMPACRNKLIDIFHSELKCVDYVLWMDDDMVPPSDTLLLFYDALESGSDKIVGCVGQAFSTITGAPFHPKTQARTCMRTEKRLDVFDESMDFSYCGGLSFSLWRASYLRGIPRPVFDREWAEDNVFIRKTKQAGYFVRAFPSLLIGHCYVENFHYKGQQKPKETLKEGERHWNGLHTIKRYEDTVPKSILKHYVGKEK